MGIASRALIIFLIFSGNAWAKGKKKDSAPVKAPAATMDANDPAAKEQVDDGPFSPNHKSEEQRAKEAADAQPHQEIARGPRDKTSVFGNLVVGFGTPPEPGPGVDDSPTNHGTSLTFVAGGRYDMSPDFTLGLRIPWTVASVRQVDGHEATSQALGGPELFGQYRIVLSPRSYLPFDFGLGLPLAQGDYDQAGAGNGYRQTIVNDLADAASGFRDGELFGPKRLPLLVGFGIDYERKALSLHALTKFVAGFKVGGTLNYLPQTAGDFQLKSVTFRNVTSAGIGYHFLNHPNLFGALDSWVAYNAVNAVEFNSLAGATGPTRLQVVFEPRVGARFGTISPSLGYIFPIGGRLADEHVSGLELHCDVSL